LRYTKRKLFIALFALLAAAVLSGCLRITADDLYSLPQVSEEYLKLQAHINSVMGLGADFSPPTGGQNRQAVQVRDLDGDGINEVIAFFSAPSDSALKIYIFEMVDGDYTVADIIEGVGTAFESVRYADIDGDGVMEIIVGWEMSAALKYMSIFSIKDYHSVLLDGTEYTGFTVYDLNGDGRDDIVALSLPSHETGAVAKVFSTLPNGEIVKAETKLSGGIDTISRVLTGRLTDGVPAIFVESGGKFENGNMVTDICVYQDGELKNISISDSSGVSDGTVRTQTNCLDINNDGVIEVPIPRLLKTQSDIPYYTIDWYAYNSEGVAKLVLTTYHNVIDEWYLILPFDWRERITVRREDAVPGERTVVFSYAAGGDNAPIDFLKVYRLYGDKAKERSMLPGRVTLLSDGAAVYAFELLAAPNSFGLTFDETLIKNNFRLIYTDWLAGYL